MDISTRTGSCGEVIDNITGDFTFLTGSISGPTQPKGDSVPVVAMGERYAFGVDEPWKAWVAYAKAGWDTITRRIRTLQ